MNDYRQRFEPSMGRFFSNRLRDSLHLSTLLTNHEREHFDLTTADEQATPEPPPAAMNLYDAHRSVITPSSTTSSKPDSYFTQSTSDTHKFSRRVELSSGYNILKSRTSVRPARLPAVLQGRTPLAQLNPLPTPGSVLPIENSDDNRPRRSSFTDHYRTQYLAYNQQFNIDGTRRPFSSDSPLPPSMPTTNHYISSAPLTQTRSAYDPIEPLKLTSEEENNSIADLSRELRAAAYPTTRKSTNHSPTRETSPSTTRYSTRVQQKRVPPARPLPRISSHDQPMKAQPHYYPYHESDKLPSTTIDERLQTSSNNSSLLDQFFNPDQTHENIPSTIPPTRTSSLPNGNDDTTMAFVSKYARLAPIPPLQATMSSSSEPILHDQTLDNSSLHTDNFLLTDDLFQTLDMNPTDSTLDDADEKYSYVPTKEQLQSLNGVPLLELDELETSSDISESQLVPIIYAKELANEIDLLQKAHLLKQQQRSMSMDNDNGRMIDNNSVPPPANMELLNFETLDEEISTFHPAEESPTPTANITSTMMEISSPPPPREILPTPPSSTEIESSLTNTFQHSLLAHNRLSPWFRLPTELWFKILRLLSNHDLHQFSYVCKRFYLLGQDRACQHRIVFHRRMNFEQIWFDALIRRQPTSLSFIQCRQQNLETTDSSSSDIHWSEFFQSISSTLLHFTMDGCYHEPFTPNKLLPLIIEFCSNLLSLNLRWNNITENTLNQLIIFPRMIHLHTLDLSACQLLDDTLLINIFIRTEKEFQLQQLILHACTKITWTSLDTIAICCPHLIHLDLSRCIGLKTLSSTEQPTCFQYWPELHSINFSYLLNLTDQDMHTLFEHCKYLQRVILDECPQLTDQTFRRFNEHLQILSLNNSPNISTDTLSQFNEQCPNLQHLHLNSINHFTDHCFIQWSNKIFKQFQRLTIDDCREYTLDNLRRFLNHHPLCRYLSMRNSPLNTHGKFLQETYPQIQFVFQ